MGRHQRAETAGLVSSLICAGVGYAGMTVFLAFAPAIWQVSQRLYLVCSAIIAACGTLSFAIGYARQSRSWNLRFGWLTPIRRVIEIAALSTVYASTLFLASFMMLGMMNELLGRTTNDYLSGLCAAFAGIAGYFTFVQATLMDAKTLSGLLPLFVVAGVTTAGLTSDDPYWSGNNFSQLGDRTTFAARMFNSTLMLAGVCVIIITYFALSELITTERLHRLHLTDNGRATDVEAKHFRTRTIILGVLLILSGIAFIGIGAFRYTPHPILHNVFARGLPGVMGVLLVGLPWVAPQFSRAMYVMSDAIIVVCCLAGGLWLAGGNTLTNVEGVAGLLFMAWFMVFTRQVAAIEADRVESRMRHIQSMVVEGNAMVIPAAGHDEKRTDPDADTGSRLATQR